MDEMRDRLIAVIKEFAKQFFKEKVTEHHATLENEHENRLADKLLAAGVILPKFRVGQEVWYSVNNPTCGGVYSSTVLAIELRDGEIYYTLNDEWGGLEHELFSTEADAWAALEGKE